jgi:Tfp pilus assembly protein PilE
VKPDDQGVIGLLSTRGLLLRSTLVVIFVSLLASLAAVAYTAYVTHQRAHQASQIRLNELLDTVESTLQVACFAKDQTLAGELAQGLLNNSDVLTVTIAIAMGRSLGLQIVAEGVELPSHLAALGEMGCHYAQGYYFSRPVPAEEFATTATAIAALLAKPSA